MAIHKFIFSLLLFISFKSTAQFIGGPQRVAKKFAKAMSSGDFEKAGEYCILELKQQMEKAADGEGYGFELTIETIGCEIVKSEYGVDCSCESEISGGRVLLIYKMTEIDGNWKIYNLDSERMEPDNNRRKNKSKKKNQNYSNASKTIEDFAAYNQQKNYKKAAAITVMAALKNYLKQSETSPGSLPVSVSNVDCFTNKSAGKTECNCDQITADGKSETAYYELILVDKKWKIIEFGTDQGAEYTVRKFVLALANGECALASQWATGAAKENVQGSIDAGCTSYHTEVQSVFCYYEDDSAFCDCTEKRDGMEMKFEYDLVREGARWVITKYQKDFGLAEESTETTYKMDSTATIEVMDYSDYGTTDQQETVVVIPDVEAQFPGGNTAMIAYINDNIIYPESARNNEEQGVVYIQFIVRTDGTITDVLVLKGRSEALDKEALRVVKSMPVWTPGQVDGVDVATYYTLPINFQLNK